MRSYGWFLKYYEILWGKNGRGPGKNRALLTKNRADAIIKRLRSHKNSVFSQGSETHKDHKNS
jgi:hypothetical protein